MGVKSLREVKSKTVRDLFDQDLAIWRRIQFFDCKGNASVFKLGKYLSKRLNLPVD